jgi:hypothetical protein
MAETRERLGADHEGPAPRQRLAPRLPTWRCGSHDWTRRDARRQWPRPYGRVDTWSHFDPDAVRTHVEKSAGDQHGSGCDSRTRSTTRLRTGEVLQVDRAFLPLSGTFNIGDRLDKDSVASQR